MGYFSNGTEGADYQAQFCDRCFHDRNNDCPVWLMHLLFNPAEVYQITLHTFIPRSNNGLVNLECKMFVSSEKNCRCDPDTLMNVRTGLCMKCGRPRQ